MYPANGSGRPHGRSASERISKLLEDGDFPTAPPTPPEGGAARAGSGISMHQVIASGSDLGELGDLGAEVHPVPPSALYVTSLPLYMHPTCSHAHPACNLIAWQVHTVQLRPSQLVLLPDGTSIGFRAPGGSIAQHHTHRVV